MTDKTSRSPLVRAGDLVELFLLSAEAGPDRLAVDTPDGALTYRELALRAGRVAAMLRAHGVRADDRVGIALAPGADVVTAILGVLMASATYVPLGITYPAAYLRSTAADADVAAVITASGNAFPGLRTDVPCLDIEEAGGRTPGDAPDAGRRGHRPAYMIYTSGSTGRPKGVVVTHANVMAMLRSTDRCFDLGADDRWTMFHSHNFDFSVWEMWGALAHGGCVVTVPDAAAADPAGFLDLLADREVTVLSQVPSVFGHLERVHRLAPPPLRLRYVVFGGESVRLDAVRSFLAAYRGAAPTMVNMYGITEVTVHATYKLLDDRALADDSRSPIGRAIPGVDIRVVRADGRCARPGETGEMYLAGPTVAHGYWDRPELTTARFVELDLGDGPRRYYRSGDLALLRPDGELDYRGRIDGQVKVRGFRIELGEVETALRSHPRIADAAVVIAASRLGEPMLKAFVVLGTGGLPRAQLRRELRGHLSALLPAHYVPGELSVVDRLPLTPSGKVDRNALPTGQVHEAAPRAADK